MLDSLWNILNGLQWRFCCSNVSSLVIFRPGNIHPNFSSQSWWFEEGGCAAITFYLLFLLAFVRWEIYLFLYAFACCAFFVVVIAVAVSAAFSVFCIRMRECVRALSFGLLYVDLFNEFVLFFETFHFNLFSTLLNCITYSFFYILSQVVFIVSFNEYFLFSLSNFFLILNRFVL